MHMMLFCGGALIFFGCECSRFRCVHSAWPVVWIISEVAEGIFGRLFVTCVRINVVFLTWFPMPPSQITLPSIRHMVIPVDFKVIGTCFPMMPGAHSNSPVVLKLFQWGRVYFSECPMVRTMFVC